jgi:hypothetical protein
MHNHIFRPVPDHHEKAAFLLLHSIANERWDARVSWEKLAIEDIVEEQAEETYTAFFTILSFNPQLKLLSMVTCDKKYNGFDRFCCRYFRVLFNFNFFLSELGPLLTR